MTTPDVMDGSSQRLRDKEFDLISRIDEAVEDALQAGITKEHIAENVSEYLLTWDPILPLDG